MTRKTFTRLSGLAVAAVLIAFAAFSLNIGAANAQAGSGSGKGGGLHGSGIQIGKALIDAVTQATNLTQKQIRQDLQSGSTLSQIVTQNNGDPAAVQAAAKATIIAQIAQAVQAGKITQAQADKLTGRLDTMLTNLMSRQIKANARGPVTVAQRILQGAAVRSLLDQTAKATNLTQQQVVQALNNGQTLAQIATTNKADPNAIVTTATTDITNRISALVKRGRLTQDQATQITANLNATLTQLMNAVNPLQGNGYGAFGNSSGANGNGQAAPQATAQPTDQPTAQPTLQTTSDGVAA